MVSVYQYRFNLYYTIILSEQILLIYDTARSFILQSINIVTFDWCRQNDSTNHPEISKLLIFNDGPVLWHKRGYCWHSKLMQTSFCFQCVPILLSFVLYQFMIPLFDFFNCKYGQFLLMQSNIVLIQSILRYETY